MAQIVSIQTTAYTTSASLTITKPVSLAVGDFMVAFIQGAQESATPPSGWSLDINYNVASGNSQMKIYTKTADSGDVAASNFTWTFGGGQYHGGSIMRITGFNTALPMAVYAQDDALATATPTFTSTVTPNTVDSLLIFCLGTYVNASGNTRTASGYAIATSNPAWTEQLDQTVDTGSASFQMSIASSIRPQITATGDASCTMSGSCTDLGNIMLVIRPQITFTATETTSIVDFNIKGVNKTLNESTSVTDTLATSKQRRWNNQDKNSSSWNNQDKH